MIHIFKIIVMVELYRQSIAKVKDKKTVMHNLQRLAIQLKKLDNVKKH